VGGKWTSFRAFSAQVTDHALKYLSKSRKAGTEDLPIRGGAGYPTSAEKRVAYQQKIAKEYGLSEGYAHALLDRYGTYAEKIAALIKSKNGKPMKSIENWNTAELQYILETEKPLHLDDVFLRRSTIGWLGNASAAVIEEFADIMAKTHNWNAGKKKAEIERVKKILAA
jgi:glycerol-3-phosphate dehydrogenase